jgi:hypothetical protein
MAALQCEMCGANKSNKCWPSLATWKMRGLSVMNVRPSCCIHQNWPANGRR